MKLSQTMAHVGGLTACGCTAMFMPSLTAQVSSGRKFGRSTSGVPCPWPMERTGGTQPFSTRKSLAAAKMSRMYVPGFMSEHMSACVSHATPNASTNPGVGSAPTVKMRMTSQ